MQIQTAFKGKAWGREQIKRKTTKNETEKKKQGGGGEQNLGDKILQNKNN